MDPGTDSVGIAFSKENMLVLLQEETEKVVIAVIVNEELFQLEDQCLQVAEMIKRVKRWLLILNINSQWKNLQSLPVERSVLV